MIWNGIEAEIGQELVWTKHDLGMIITSASSDNELVVSLLATLVDTKSLYAELGYFDTLLATVHSQ